MRLKRTIFTSLLVLPVLLITNSANATPVTGQANIAGNVTVQDGNITFAPTFTNTAGAMETGAFAGLTGGTIQSLTGGPITGFLPTPVTGFVNFATGVAAPVIFDLTFIAPGVGTQAGCFSAALGSACTPTGSPFTLFQLSSNTVLAALQLNGVSYTGSSATGTSPTTAIFSTQTAINGTLPEIFGILASGGAISGVTYSASFVATSSPVVPEPASMMLMGVGLIVAGLVARRKVRS
ncbi:MAG: PEP-CTERM sorting domain-containing protein [Bryobacteraceae bacterium]